MAGVCAIGVSEIACRHDIGDDPIAVANSIRAQYPGTLISSVGVPGINGYLSPIDYQELLG